MRCAKALVLHRVEPHFIEGVAHNNFELSRRLQQQRMLPVGVDRSLFF